MHEHEGLDREATPSEAVRARGSVRILLRRCRRLKEGAAAESARCRVLLLPPECDSKSSEAADECPTMSHNVPQCPIMSHNVPPERAERDIRTERQRLERQ